MKKYIFIIAVLLGFISNINAQEQQDININTEVDTEINIDTYMDGFFSNSKLRYRTASETEILPMLPDGYNYFDDFNAADPNNPVPLSSGLLILTGLALCYSQKRRNE